MLSTRNNVDPYIKLFSSLSLEEQRELFEIKRKYNWILNKQRSNEQLRKVEEEWILNRPHYISTNRIGIDLVEGELIYLK